MARLVVSSLGAMGTDTDGGHFGSQKRGVSVFDDQGTEWRGDQVFDMRRQCQIPACRVARSQKKAPCPNKRAPMERCLGVALPEVRGAIGAALKPAGVLSWGSTLPPDDSKQGPRGIGMISGIWPVVFSTTSWRRKEKWAKVEASPPCFLFLGLT